MSLLLLLRPRGAEAPPDTTRRGVVTWAEFEAPDLAAEEPAAVARRIVGGRRYRIIEDPDRLCEELKVEEKKLEKAKRKLVILQKQQVSPQGIYKDFEPQIAAVEKAIDDRLERIAELNCLIALGLEAQQQDDDDEEDIFLMS